MIFNRTRLLMKMRKGGESVVEMGGRGRGREGKRREGARDKKHKVVGKEKLTSRRGKKEQPPSRKKTSKRSAHFPYEEKATVQIALLTEREQG